MIGVRIKKNRRLCYFKWDEEYIEQGQSVLVETEKGIEFGIVEKNNIKDTKENLLQLKKIIKIATEEDKKQNIKNIEYEKEAFKICNKKIKEHNLEMKLVDTDLMFDCSKIIFYFISDGRIDFRNLVKDLAIIFKMRIELRQIGVRDEVQLLNGVGICGRSLCCSTFLVDFHPVSIKMAKDQNLSLNPTKISGVCGRLMCCLKYEEDIYININKKLPKESDIIQTPDGEGVVISVSPLKELVKAAIRVKSKEEEIVVNYYNLNEIKILKSKKNKDNTIIDTKLKDLEN